MPALQQVQTISVAKATMPSPLDFVFDFGQEFTGWVQVTLPASLPAGSNVTIKYAEAMDHPPFAEEDGHVWMGNLFWSWPVDYYIAAGSGAPETYAPRFGN
jgi:alpha-L-rhamnosidase